MERTLINLVDISKQFGDTLVLDEMNLTVRENEL